MRLFTRGFTLAELLAVVIITALMTSFGIGYYKRSVAQAEFSDNVVKANRAVEIANQEYFEKQWQGFGNPTSVSSGKSSGNDYTVEVLPDFVPSGSSYPRGRVACVAENAKGKSFCESMGYLDCAAPATSGKYFTTLSSANAVCIQQGK